MVEIGSRTQSGKRKSYDRVGAGNGLRNRSAWGGSQTQHRWNCVFGDDNIGRVGTLGNIINSGEVDGGRTGIAVNDGCRNVDVGLRGGKACAGPEIIDRPVGVIAHYRQIDRGGKAGDHVLSRHVIDGKGWIGSCGHYRGRGFHYATDWVAGGDGDNLGRRTGWKRISSLGAGII